MKELSLMFRLNRPNGVPGPDKSEEQLATESQHSGPGSSGGSTTTTSGGGAATPGVATP